MCQIKSDNIPYFFKQQKQGFYECWINTGSGFTNSHEQTNSNMLRYSHVKLSFPHQTIHWNRESLLVNLPAAVKTSRSHFNAAQQVKQWQQLKCSRLNPSVRFPALLVFLCDANPTACYFNPSSISQKSTVHVQLCSDLKRDAPPFLEIQQRRPVRQSLSVCLCKRKTDIEWKSAVWAKVSAVVGCVHVCVCSDHTLGSVQLDW